MILLTLDVAHMKRLEKSSETVQRFQQTCCSKNSVTLKKESDKNAKVASYEEHLTMKLFTMYWWVTRGYATPATLNALCFHVWICNQVWLNLPSDNCPLFSHLPTDDDHFGHKQKQFAKKKTH
jgi:hypothetical protein